MRIEQIRVSRAIESRAVTAVETFSVFSPVVECGVKKPTIVTTVMKADGMIRLKM